MLVDLDYFYAQCEEVRAPSLKNKPVVICVYSGRTEESGAVSTANYIARRLGVKSGIPISQAKRLLENQEQAIFLPVDRLYYTNVSKRVMVILKNHSDICEQVSIDEAFLDASMMTNGDFERARILAITIKEEIRRQENLTCTIGIAPDKITAKVAADFHKPDGLTVVRQEEASVFLAPLPVEKLYGIGRKTEKKIADMGVETIGQLAVFPVEKLVKMFGKRLGIYFHNAANGLDIEPVQENSGPVQISRILTLKEDTRDFTAICAELDKLAEDVHQHLVEARLYFHSVGVIAILDDFSTHTRVKTMGSHTSDIILIKKYAYKLIQELLTESGEHQIRRVGVKLFGFIRQTSQATLSDFPPSGNNTVRS